MESKTSKDVVVRKETLSFEEINKRLGGFGRYQKQIYLLLCFPAVICAFHKLAKNFLQYEPKFRCQLPNEYSNSSYDIVDVGTDTDYQPSECSYHLDNHTETCHGKYIYDQSVYKSTIVTEWNLVCENTYYLTLSESLFMVGVMLGSIIFGYLSDRYGRKKVFLGSLLLQTVCGFLTAFSPDFITYLIARFILATSVSGVFLVAYVIALEMVTPEKRQVAGVGINISFSIGYCALTLFAYWIRDWRTFQVAITVTGVIFFAYIWLIPESIRWLIANRRADEAKSLLKKVAETNKIDYPIDSIVFENEEKPKDDKQVTLWDIFRNPRLCKRLIIIFFNWLVNSATYYGLSWNVSSLGNNIFLDYFILGIVEIPANLSLLLLLNKFGRQKTLCGYMLIAGSALLITAFFKDEWVVLILTMIGKGAITASYSTIYIFTVEQFPTNIRNTVLGACSTSARIGGILAPQINLLGRFWVHFPNVVFGIAAIITGALSFLLPETANKKLPDSLTDFTAIKSNKKSNTEKNTGKKNGANDDMKKIENGFSILYT